MPHDDKILCSRNTDLANGLSVSQAVFTGQQPVAVAVAHWKQHGQRWPVREFCVPSRPSAMCCPFRPNPSVELVYTSHGTCVVKSREDVLGRTRGGLRQKFGISGGWASCQHAVVSGGPFSIQVHRCIVQTSTTTFGKRERPTPGGA